MPTRRPIDTFNAFVKSKELSGEYNRITSKYDQDGGKGITITDLVTGKNKFAIEGPNDDLVLAFNASPFAPSIAKDITGKFF
jgi:hypothetical protein